MGIQINGQTDTVTSTTAGGSVTVTPLAASSGLNVGTGASISSPATNVLTLGTNNSESVRLDSSGRLGIGTNNPNSSAGLDILKGEICARGIRALANKPISGVWLGKAISGNAVIEIVGDTGTTAEIDFSVPNTDMKGRVAYDLTSDYMYFSTNSVERVRIESGGNVKLSTAGTKVLNSSGNPILNQTGSILQVVSTIKTDTFTTSSSGNTAITGLSASITPSSTSNKILVMYSINYDSNRGNSGGGFRIFRDGSHITASSGAAAGNRYTVSGDFGSNNDPDQSGMHRSFTYLYSPGSISSLTYQIYTYQDSTFTTYINRARADADQGDDGRYASTITLMEVAG